MSWKVQLNPEVEQDVTNAAAWYESRQPGLGSQFTDEIIRILELLADNPLLHCRRHPTKNLRWRYPERFPYRIVYQVDEPHRTVIVAAVLHAARHDRHWKKRT
ncbi:MAG TPA: type II toxin-antitoxin system RelE/ParE family toxin [Roseimicrobium sp.]|nr:type II toxin-antitoxin system RelE/ParE family toxin [Roseimicrobium sp.]